MGRHESRFFFISRNTKLILKRDQDLVHELDLIFHVNIARFSVFRFDLKRDPDLVLNS
jgi:hypothetical protein